MSERIGSFELFNFDVNPLTLTYNSSYMQNLSITHSVKDILQALKIN